MKNKYKITLITLLSLIFLSGCSYFLYWTFKPQTIQNKITKNYLVSINGAVKNPGKYEFYQPKTIREIIFKANVLTNADFDSLDLDKTINENCEIIVPYKVDSIKKIKWSKLNSIDQLTKLGVKKSVALSVIEHRRQNESTTWERILSLKGIGEKTLAQLKDLIDLS